MKLRNLKFSFLFMAISLALLTSCIKTQEVDLAAQVIEESNIYKGVFNSGTFQSVNYMVTITRINNSTIKITPEDSNGSSFEITLQEGAGGKIENSAQGQFVLSELSGNAKSLIYNINGDQFSGDND